MTSALIITMIMHAIDIPKGRSMTQSSTITLIQFQINDDDNHNADNLGDMAERGLTYMQTS